MATDIFTLNTALAATIEDSMVKTLNDLRTVWDPKDEYETYAFVRQPQTFPDVVLRRVDNGEDVLLGIELKGWYLLAKEEAPTYRFTVTEAACNQNQTRAAPPVGKLGQLCRPDARQICEMQFILRLRGVPRSRRSGCRGRRIARRGWRWRRRRSSACRRA